jgi:hypothetical protein
VRAPWRVLPLCSALSRFSRQSTCDDRLGCWHRHSRGTLLFAMLVCFERDAECTQCGASVTCAPLQKASDGMLISGMPIPGCHSPLPLGPTFAFEEIGLGLLPTAATGREDHRQPTSVTTLDGPAAGAQLRQGRRAAGGPGNLPTARARAAPGWAGRAVAAELQPAKRAAGGPKPTPGRRCGPGAACKPVALD